MWSNLLTGVKSTSASVASDGVTRTLMMSSVVMEVVVAVMGW